MMMPPKKIGSSDNFYTPNYAISPIVPYLNKEWKIWECCSGTGNIVITTECISSGKEWFGISENGMSVKYCGNISEIKNLLMEIKK